MTIGKKYLRGTIRHVAEQLDLSYAGARLRLINEDNEAIKIAFDYEEKKLAQEFKAKEMLREKEVRIQQMKQELGKKAN